MLFNQLAEGRFSAIAASFNLAVKRDCAKARSPSISRWASKLGFDFAKSYRI